MLKKTADITFKNDTFFVAGDLDFANVMTIYNTSLPTVQKTSKLNFDFSQLRSNDSAGIALIIEWLKLAKQDNKPISFLNLSDDLLAIAKAASLDKLILNQS